MRSAYIALAGGVRLDLPSEQLPPGALIDCKNFETKSGVSGYSLVNGYERFDGRTLTSKVAIRVINFISGTAVINVGDIVTTATSSSEVVQVTLTSGTWGSNAAGRLLVVNFSGSVIPNQLLQVSAANKATASTAEVTLSSSVAADIPNIVVAREYWRAKIQKVPGVGPVRAVTVYNGSIYAIRDEASGETCAMYKATASGWTSIRTGLRSRGTFNFAQYNFGGQGSNLHLFGVDGFNRPFKFNGSVFTQIGRIYDTDRDSTTSVAIGSGSKSFTFTATAANPYAIGASVLVYRTADAYSFMVGDVTAATTTTVTINVTSFHGSGTYTDWQMHLSDNSDIPFAVAAVNNYLFLGFRGAQLQTSNVGDPMNYGSGSAFGIGDEITNLVPLRGGTLGVFCKNQVIILSGNSSATFKLSPHTTTSGAILASAVEVGGDAVFLDDGRIISLTGTADFGSFNSAVVSDKIKSWLAGKYPLFSFAKSVREKGQIRFYFSDGFVLTVTPATPAEGWFSGASCTFQQYAHIPTCGGFDEPAGLASERYFGTSDGYVMKDDSGQDFDGTVITAYFQVPFWNFKSPSLKKRFFRERFNWLINGIVTFSLRNDFNFTTSTVTPTSISVSSSDNYEKMAQVSGIGTTMSTRLVLNSVRLSDVEVSGVDIHYDVWGVTR